VLALHAQPATESGADISCIQRLVVPNYPALARAARIAADVTVSVVIGHDSASHQITTQVEKPHGGIRRFFSERVEKAVRSSTFNHQCVGKTIELEFSFEPGNDMPIEGSKQTISFSYPNRFTITSTAMILNP
jgi:outer membrane biosynthesis protein TonB